MGTRRTYVHNSAFAKEFKNGNISIKYDANTIKEAQKDELLTLSEILNSIDCYFVGETFCLSNYATGHLIYNLYSDLVYVFNWQWLKTLKQGKTIKLYVCKPDDDDREIIKEFMGK